MKSKNKSKPKKQAGKNAEPKAPAPGIDEIITISRDSGRAMLEMKKDEQAQLREDVRPDAKPEEPKEEKPVKFRLPKKSESIISTRKPRADAVPEEKTVASKQPIAKKEAAVPKEEPEAKASETKPVTNETEPKPKSVSAAPLSGSKLALAEAALFLSPKPLMLDELARIMGVNSLGYVKETLEKLVKDYENRGIEVVSSAAGWEMQVRPIYLNSVAHLAPYADLSEGPKRALALILFKEPLKQSDLIKMQGNKTYDYLRTLDKLGMIKREPCGRTKRLTLTKEFERYFGEEKDRVKERMAQEFNMQPASTPAQAAPAPPKKKINAKAELNRMGIVGIELEEG